MSGPGGSNPAELARYKEMLEPLVELPAGGAAEPTPEERAGWDAAVATLRGYHGNHLDLEEAVAFFARVFWTAPGWAEPGARIAEGLVVRTKHWPPEPRAELLALARRFAERAVAGDPASVPARVAHARVKLACGEADDAERVASALPSDDAAALALRSDIAEARGRREDAIALRASQLVLEPDVQVARDARNKLGLLYQAAGRLEDAVLTHRQNLTRHPEYAWGRVNLASALEAKGELAEAFGECDTAVVLGLAEARPFLEELGAALDRKALDRFRRLLRTGRDGDPVDLCPAPAALPAARAGLTETSRRTAGEAGASKEA